MTLTLGNDVRPRSRGYKTVFMLNSAEHDIVPAKKCSNANNSWYFNIYEPEK